jgi:glycosyltransferase involved in cell wall biosynthesis
MLLHVNGRFYGQAVTGVQRYGRELVGALDRHLSTAGLPRPFTGAALHVPAADRHAVPPFQTFEVQAYGGGRGHRWEQLSLPGRTRGGVLFCAGNSAPLRSLLGRASRVVVTIHSLSWRAEPGAYSPAYRAWYRVMTPLIARHAQRIITVAQAERDGIASAYPAAADRLVTIQNGATIPAPAPDAPLPPSPYVLFVGSLARLKNLAGAIAAFAVLARARPDLRLAVAGTRSPALSGGDLQIPAAIAPRVVFLGQIEDPARLAAVYAGAACLVVPSFYEASPLPPIEAMAQGCPVAAADLPALRERCGDAALYFDARQPEAIAGTVARILDDIPLAEKLRRRGAERVRRFSWTVCASETLAVLAEAACV